MKYAIQIGVVRYERVIVFLLVASYIVSCNATEINKTFDKPENTYRMNKMLHSVPVSNEKQQELIDKTLSAGYGGFATNVSYDQYHTDAGLKSFKTFVNKAKSSGLELWLYDELGYPSGNAGGRVIQKNKNWEAMGIFNKDTLVSAGKVEFKLSPGKLLEMMAINTNKKDTVDLTSFIEGDSLVWDVPAGRWKVNAYSKDILYRNFQASQQPNSPSNKLTSHYPSLMIPEVTKAFLETTHEVYTEYLGTNLGKYFISTFTDEPSLMAVQYGRDNWSVLPWTELLSETMESRYGYRPENRLQELFEDTTSTGQRSRYQYFHTISDLISTNYFEQIKDWNSSHNFKSGGHLLLEETMMAHAPLYGDIFASFRQMDIPGIDVLSVFPENTPIYSAKLASSAAELTGSPRVMSEPNSVVDRIRTGKEPDINLIRGSLNIQLLGGITDFNSYLKFTEAEASKLTELNDYIGRVAMLLRGGHTVADIAVMYPIESLWAEYIPKPLGVADWDSVYGGHQKAIDIDQSFQNTSEYLYENRWEHQIIDMQAVENAEIQHGQLVHSKLKWKVVILPNVTTLSRLAWKKLHRFVKSGGHIIAIGQTPFNSTQNFPDTEIENISEEVFSLKNVIQVESLTELNQKEFLNTWLKKELTVDNSSDPLRFTHRIIDKKNVYFVINNSDESIESNVSLQSASNLKLWDPLNNKVSSFEDNTSLQLEPYHGVILREK